MLNTTKEFDKLPVGRLAAQVQVSVATPSDITEIYGPFAALLPDGCATLDTVQAVAAAHPFNAWSIRNRRDGVLSGIYLMIMLSKAGHTALLDGSITPIQPAKEHLATGLEDISAIYKWGVFAKGVAAGAVPLIAAELRRPRFSNVPLYGRAASPEGRHLMEAVGFVPVTDTPLTSLFKYERIKNRAIPSPQRQKQMESNRA